MTVAAAMLAIKSAFEAINDASSIARAVELNPSIDRSAITALARARDQLQTAWEELHDEAPARVERDREGGATLLLMLAEMFIWRRAKTVSWNLDGPRLTLNIVVAKDAADALKAATDEQIKDDGGQVSTLAHMSIGKRFEYAERQASRWQTTLEELNASINESAYRNKPLPDMLRGRADLRERIVATALKLVEDFPRGMRIRRGAEDLGSVPETAFESRGRALAEAVIEYADRFFTGIA